MNQQFASLLLSAILFAGHSVAFAQVAPGREAAIKADLNGQIDSMAKRAQVMVDSVFSFGELGFQEVETSKYLTGILEKEGFQIERGHSGHSHRLDGHLGQGQARHRAGLRH